MDDIVYEDIFSCSQEELSAFRYLDFDELKELSGFFQCVKVEAGKTIWNENEPCDYMAFVVSGRVEVKKNTEFEGKQIVVGLYSKGTVVGALCVLDNSPRAVTAAALDDVSLVTITREEFYRLLDTKPQTGIKLLKGILFSVSRRLRSSFERLASFF